MENSSFKKKQPASTNAGCFVYHHQGDDNESIYHPGFCFILGLYLISASGMGKKFIFAVNVFVSTSTYL